MPASTIDSATDLAAIDPFTITIDRRRNERRDEETISADSNKRPATKRPVADAAKEKTQRRRHIDPTTCERDYSDHEIEFMRAMDDYKQTSGRMFPTCSEVLEVLRSLGYARLTEEQFNELGIDGTSDADFDASESSDEEADELLDA